MNSSALTLVAWAALIASIIALILAWAAFNRAGEDLENQVQREVQDALQTTNETVN